LRDASGAIGTDQRSSSEGQAVHDHALGGDAEHARLAAVPSSANGGASRRTSSAVSRPDSWLPAELRASWRDVPALAGLAADRFAEKRCERLPVVRTAAWLFWLWMLTAQRLRDRVVARDGRRAVLCVAPLAPRPRRDLPWLMRQVACWLAIVGGLGALLGLAYIPIFVAYQIAVLTGSPAVVEVVGDADLVLLGVLFLFGVYPLMRRVLQLRSSADRDHRRRLRAADGTWWEVTTLAGSREVVTAEWLRDELLPVVDARGIGLFAKAANPKLINYYRRLGFSAVDSARPNLMCRPAATPVADMATASAWSAAA
jgi:hypothetical protein